MNALARLIEGLITFHKSILLAALECFQLEPFRQYGRTQKNQNYHNQNDNLFVDFSLVVVVLDFNVHAVNCLALSSSLQGIAPSLIMDGDIGL